MTKTTSADLELKKAQAKFTRLKAAVDGTPEAEEKYQKAKKGLAMHSPPLCEACCVSRR